MFFISKNFLKISKCILIKLEKYYDYINRTLIYITYKIFK